jgi:hypothetical protein
VVAGAASARRPGLQSRMDGIEARALSGA